MVQLKNFRIDVFLANGEHLETHFTQALEEGQVPATRFYLGYSTDTAMQQDLPWIAVGDIAYLPDEAVAIRIVPVERPVEIPARSSAA